MTTSGHVTKADEVRNLIATWRRWKESHAESLWTGQQYQQELLKLWDKGCPCPTCAAIYRVLEG